MTTQALIRFLPAIGIVWQVGTVVALGADENAVATESPASVAGASAESSGETPADAATPSAIEGPSDVSAPQGPPPGAAVDAIRDDLDIVGEVVGAPTGRVIFAAGDVVSLRLNKSSIDPKPGLTLAIVRPAQRVRHPRSHRSMGRVVKAVGAVELREAFGRFWSARVVRSFDAVSVGDVLLPVGADEATEAASSSADDGGYIVAVPGPKALTSAYEVVYTDLGRNHGAQAGHAFSIIREGTRGRQGGPARKIGEGRVVAVQPSSSSLYVTRSSEPIQVGDRLERVAADAAP